MSPPPRHHPKRQKLTSHARNGGAPDSFLPLDTFAGSDTEDEADEATAQHYLDKMTDDTDRPVETVFGAGVKVWKSHGGTLYAVGHEEGGVKRKRGDEVKDVPSKEDDEDGEEKGKDGEVLPPSLFTPISPTLPSHIPLPIPTPTPYPPRSPHTTQFHHSSAGIDTLGAYNRPIKPLPTKHQDIEDLPGNASAPKRIVSGSFGSFEGVRPSQFDERGYSLLPGKYGEKGEQGKLDPFKRRPWLRR